VYSKHENPPQILRELAVPTFWGIRGKIHEWTIAYSHSEKCVTLSLLIHQMFSLQMGQHFLSLTPLFHSPFEQKLNSGSPLSKKRKSIRKN
jgi:hypothetical protein